MYNKFPVFALVLVLMTGLAVAADRVAVPPLPAGTASGTPAALGKGVAYSWVKTDASGKPAAIGISISEAAIKSLPQADQKWTLDIPDSTFGALTLIWHTGKQAGFEIQTNEANTVLAVGLGLFDKDFAIKDKLSAANFAAATYSVSYDRTRKEYQIVFTDFQR
jgi:hypothetical protein